jgi:hypothetical protein
VTTLLRTLVYNLGARTAHPLTICLFPADYYHLLHLSEVNAESFTTYLMQSSVLMIWCCIEITSVAELLLERFKVRMSGITKCRVL